MYCMLSSSFTNYLSSTVASSKMMCSKREKDSDLRSKIFQSGLTTENPLVLLSVHNLFPEGLEKWPSCRTLFPYLRTPGQSINS